MSGLSQLTLFFSLFVNQLPMLLVCLVAIGLVLTRWRQKSPALPWALMGFGLALFLCFAIPVAQLALQNWVMSSSGEMSRRATIWGAISIFWSILHALSYGLLAVAIFVGQSQRKGGSPSSASRPQPQHPV